MKLSGCGPATALLLSERAASAPSPDAGPPGGRGSCALLLRSSSVTGSDREQAARLGEFVAGEQTLQQLRDAELGPYAAERTPNGDPGTTEAR